jgi:hypothetical protein
MLLKLQGKILLSGYSNDLYKPLEAAGWKRHDFKVACNATARTRGTGLIGNGAFSSEKDQRVESVWVSPNAQARSKAKAASIPTFGMTPPIG